MQSKGFLAEFSNFGSALGKAALWAEVEAAKQKAPILAKNATKYFVNKK